MPPPSVCFNSDVVCGRLPRPPEARSCSGALAVNLLSTSHPPPSLVDFQDFGPPPQGSVAPKLEPKLEPGSATDARKQKWHEADQDENSFLFCPQSNTLLQPPDFDAISTSSGRSSRTAGDTSNKTGSSALSSLPAVTMLPCDGATGPISAYASVSIGACGCPYLVTDHEVLDAHAVHKGVSDTDAAAISRDDLQAIFALCDIFDDAPACSCLQAQQTICTLRQVSGTIRCHAEVFAQCVTQRLGEAKFQTTAAPYWYIWSTRFGRHHCRCHRLPACTP